MDWMYFVIWAIGLPIAVLLGYRATWAEVSELKCAHKGRDRCPGYTSYSRKCPMHTRHEQHPNIWDDSLLILWMPLGWPLTLLLVAIYGASVGAGWTFRTLTMPKKIKQQRLPDLRKANK